MTSAVRIAKALLRHEAENRGGCHCDECNFASVQLAEITLLAIDGLNSYKGMTKGIGLCQPAVTALDKIALVAKRKLP